MNGAPAWQQKYTLRDYQQDFCRKVTEGFERGVDGQRFTRQLGVGATGCGKTIMGSALMYREVKVNNGRCLFLADTDELVAQAADKIYRTCGIIADLEKEESRAELDSEIIVASIQSMARPARLARFPTDNRTFIVADEAHLSLADNWQRVLQHFSKSRILGITATPARGDKKNLMRFYEHIAANIDLFTLIRKGALVPIQVRTVGIEIDARNVTSEGGEDQEQMANAVEPYLDAVIDAIQAHAANRKTLIFHPSRKSSRKFTAMLIKRGLGAMHIDGESENRAGILQAYSRGDFQFLNNAQLLSKGYDEPTISCVINLRLTTVKTAYQQMIGRGTRLWCPHGCHLYCQHADRKENLLILDFLWQFAKLAVMRPADLAADAPEQREALQKRLEKGDQLDLMATNEDVSDDREQQMIDAMKRARKFGGRVFDASIVAAACHMTELIDYEPMAKWEEKAPTEKQIARLTKWGIDMSTVTSRGQASVLLTKMLERFKGNMATIRQVATLRSRGFHDAHQLTLDAASQLIGSGRAA